MSSGAAEADAAGRTATAAAAMTKMPIHRGFNMTPPSPSPPNKRLTAISEDALVSFASDLIAIPSENPPARAYGECVARIGAELDALSIAYRVVETGEPDAPRQSILATVGEDGPLLYLHGHYDVVPAFRADQFVPRVEDGRLIGRGSP